MKKLILSIALIVGTLSTFAQGPKHDGARDKGERMEHRVEKMTESLALTAEQQEKVKSLMTSQREKMQAQRKANHEAFNGEMKNILSDEQYTKWVAQREEMKNHKQSDKGKCEKKCSKKGSKK